MTTEQQGAAAPSEREQFEAYARRLGYRLDRSRGGNYLYGQAAIAWRAWQAARAQPPAVVEPLTDAQLVKCIEAAGFKTWDSRMWELKRQIEAAHGIGIKKGDSNAQ